MKYGILASLIMAGLLAGFLWQREVRKNVILRAQIETLEAQREADNEATASLLENLRKSMLQMQQRLNNLSRIDDEEGLSFLDQLVPDSVRELFAVEPNDGKGPGGPGN